MKEKYNKPLIQSEEIQIGVYGGVYTDLTIDDCDDDACGDDAT
jgi:hypothetical protein